MFEKFFMNVVGVSGRPPKLANSVGDWNYTIKKLKNGSVIFERALIRSYIFSYFNGIPITVEIPGLL